ncbi:KilA-N domain-containing protein [Myxococcus xanthus]|uniref:KilA-N domain-containing protein n=1 Tax=Myxococcus xanthus TaxID=34 RepID=UPI0019174251|nr:KilA-N domain-containing protein [Myxococcus xanthus]QQR47751.1 KilA-N domain-containing protein [Myxococcus xanthus]
MTCRSDSLVVGDVIVRQDSNGRYCLNDLHRAAGLEKRHQPSDFMRNASTVALIEEIRSGDSRNDPVEVRQGGTMQGTFVCRTLVFRYAAWVSATFELKVYKVFEDFVDGRLAPTTPSFPVPKSLSEALRLAADLADKVEEQKRQLVAQQPDVDLAQRYLSAKGDRCLRDAATALRVPPKQFNDYLVQAHICYRRPQQPGQKRKNRLLPHAEYVEKGYLVNRARLVSRETREAIVQEDRGQTMVTPKGMAWLHMRLAHLTGPKESPPLLQASFTPR